MRAALLEAPQTPLVVVDDVEIEPPRAGEVLVRIDSCGVCHSDYSVVNGTFPAPGPIVLGHEAAGIVAEVGPGVSTLAPGDRVLLAATAACGRCYFCVRGDYGCCVNGAAVVMNSFADGSTRLSRQGTTVWRGIGVGGFGEYVVTQEVGAVKLPDDIPLDVACVIGCAVQTGVGAVLNTAKVEAGATVLVMGLGGVGVAIVQGARIAGASRIIVSDPSAERRAAAARFGATDAIDPTGEDVVARVTELTGVGADYAFDAVGRAALVETGMLASRPGGTTVMVGAAPVTEAVRLDPAVMFCISERKLMGCFLGSCNTHREVPRFVDLWRSGRLDLEGMITARRPLGEINEAFADMEAVRGLRTVLRVAE